MVSTFENIVGVAKENASDNSSIMSDNINNKADIISTAIMYSSSSMGKMICRSIAPVQKTFSISRQLLSISAIWSSLSENFNDPSIVLSLPASYRKKYLMKECSGINYFQCSGICVISVKYKISEALERNMKKDDLVTDTYNIQLFNANRLAEIKVDAGNGSEFHLNLPISKSYEKEKYALKVSEIYLRQGKYLYYCCHVKMHLEFKNNLYNDLYVLHKTSWQADVLFSEICYHSKTVKVQSRIPFSSGLGSFGYSDNFVFQILKITKINVEEGTNYYLNSD